MAESWKRKTNGSIFKNTLYKQWGIINTWDCYSVSKASKNLIQRLKQHKVLDDHTGCVNTVSWSDSGSLLLSGSDDYSLNIYDSYSTQLVHSIKSGHTANIFSAKFLPCTSDTKIVSCAGDGMLQYNIIGTEYGQNPFNCHSGTTYEVLVTPGDPNSFLSCGEDGTVRLFDLRTKTKCNCQECAEDILIDAKHAVTSVSINPMLPYHLAIGCKDSFVRVFDRRTLGTSLDTRSVNRNRGWMPGLFCKFKPSTFKQDSNCRVTSLQYSNDGNDLLVSYCSDYIYLFTVREESSKVDQVSTNHQEELTDPSESLTDNLPPAKRLRLRGDWSDTGPNARPDTDEEDSPEQNIMQRMSEFFSRWIEGAMSSTVRHASTSSEDSDVAQPTPGSSMPIPGTSMPTPGSSMSTPVGSHSQSHQEEESAISNQRDEPFSSALPNEDGDIISRPLISFPEEVNPNTDLGEIVAEQPVSVENPSNSADTTNGSQTNTTTETSITQDKYTGGSDEHTPLLNNNRPLDLPSSSRDYLHHSYQTTNTSSDISDSAANPLDSANVAGSSSISDSVEHHTPLDPDSTTLNRPSSSEHHQQPCHRFLAVAGRSDSTDHDEEESPTTQASDTSESTSSATSSHSELPITTLATNESEDEFELDEAFRERLRDAYASGTRYTMERQHAASKIQSFIRIHREKQKEIERANARKPNHMYTPKEKIMYRGHRNARTMIKEANFWGDDFVLSGSDCGRVFIWDRHTAELVMLLEGDRHVVNCVQPHPFDPVLATSGIDHDIKIWAPLAEKPATLDHAEDIMKRNERMLEDSRDTITVPAAFVLRMFASLGSIRRNRRRMTEEDHEEDQSSD